MIGNLYHVLSRQNADLARANLHLEDRVAQRTAELAQTNEELKLANVRLEAFSRTDGLLQLANRAYFDTRLAEACATAFRREQPLGLLIRCGLFQALQRQLRPPGWRCVPAGGGCCSAGCHAARQRSGGPVWR